MSVIKVDQIESLNGTDEVSIPTLEPRMARAWVTYNGNASTITDSYNVLSVTDNGVGRHTVSFIDEVPTGYSVAGSVRSTSQTVSIGSTNEYSTSVDHIDQPKRCYHRQGPSVCDYFWKSIMSTQKNQSDRRLKE